MKNERAQEFIKLHEKLKADRQMWDSHWREIAEYIVPNKDNIHGGKTSGEKKFQELYDGTAIHSNELLASALHGMLTNPTTPWFSLTTGDQKLDSRDDVRKWIQDSVRVIHSILNNSNFQTEIHEVYLDLGSFGTGALLIEEDEVDVVRFLSIPIYQMYIDENHKGQVGTVTRCYPSKVKDIVDEFGREVFEKSTDYSVKKYLDDPHKEVEVLHVVVENTAYNPYKLAVENKFKYTSIYILKDCELILEEKGYHTFPLAVPRWTKVSGEKYGRSPGMKSLPDTKMINQMMKTTLRSAQKIVDPPLQAPDDGMNQVRTTPGGITYYRAGTKDRVEPILTGGRIDFGFQLMEDVRTRIRSSFFIDQLQLKDGPQMTATEVMQRTEEQLRLLGPILGRQHNELLRPLIDRVFEILIKRNKLPRIPAVLQGKKIDVQYSSMIARAQKTAELESMNRFFGLAGPIMQVDQTVVDNFNADSGVRYIANTLQLPYELMRDQTDVKKLREARSQQAAKMEQQQDNLANAEVLSKTAPVLEGANAQAQ